MRTAKTKPEAGHGLPRLKRGGPGTNLGRAINANNWLSDSVSAQSRGQPVSERCGYIGGRCPPVKRRNPRRFRAFRRHLRGYFALPAMIAANGRDAVTAGPPRAPMRVLAPGAMT